MAGDNYLFDEYPLLISPKLAQAIGLNNAIVLQQINYWIEKNRDEGRNFKYGHYWTYNTYDEWRVQFPFWSLLTVKRILWNLDKKKLIIKGRFNKLNIDRTTWYRINHEEVAHWFNMNQTEAARLVQSGLMDWSNLNQPIPEINTETYNGDSKNIWKDVSKLLKSEISKANFETWIADLKPVSFDGRLFVVGAKNAFGAEYLTKNLRSLVESKLAQVVGGRVQVVFQVGTERGK